MSAICGIINTNIKEVSKDEGLFLVDKLNIYKYDKCRIWHKGEAFLGNCLQVVTPESSYEELPYYDAESGLCISSDAIIDNRDELFRLLEIKTPDTNEIPDSQLILSAYKKWGRDCPKYLVGDFTFAIWNEEKHELFCARDHVGKRSVYFYKSEKYFVFCTIIKPILDLVFDEVELNEKWIADFLALEGVVHEIDINETIYKHIYQVPPGHYIVFNSEGITKERYWTPEKTKLLRLKSDFEYIEAFNEIFNEAVKCRLRTEGNIGIMLSGGLDSTSVAAVAAKALNESGRKLEAFTSLPMIEYKNNLPKGLIADESEYANELKSYYDNINLNYCRSEGKNSVTNIDEFIAILEQPYKMVDNLFWINEITSLAADKGCKILLDGQFGNFTISYGNYIGYVYSLFKKYKWITIYKEIKEISELRNADSLQVAKIFVKKIMKSIGFTNFFTKDQNNSQGLITPVNPDLAVKWATTKRARSLGYNVLPNKIPDISDVKGYITNSVLFSHMGSLETKFSLAHKIVKRDPTRDKRVIEFCLSLPEEQFVGGGTERYLIRRAMQGILPDKIRLNKARGKQSADWMQRLIPHWSNIYFELNKMLEAGSNGNYLNIDKLNTMLKNIGTDLDTENSSPEVKTLLITLVFDKFMKSIKQDA